MIGSRSVIADQRGATRPTRPCISRVCVHAWLLPRVRARVMTVDDTARQSILRITLTLHPSHPPSSSRPPSPPPSPTPTPLPPTEQPVYEDQRNGLDSPLQPPFLYSHELSVVVRKKVDQQLREVYVYTWYAYTHTPCVGRWTSSSGHPLTLATCH